MRQRTKRHAPGPMYKLSISSFLTLPHPLSCLNCLKDIMIIMLVLHMMGGWDGWVQEGTGGGYHNFIYFLFCFCGVVNCYFMTGALQLLSLFLCSFFSLFISVHVNQALLVQRGSCVHIVELFQKSGSDHYPVDFLEEGRVLYVNYSLGSLPCFIYHN